MKFATLNGLYVFVIRFHPSQKVAAPTKEPTMAATFARTTSATQQLMNHVKTLSIVRLCRPGAHTRTLDGLTSPLLGRSFIERDASVLVHRSAPNLQARVNEARWLRRILQHAAGVPHILTCEDDDARRISCTTLHVYHSMRNARL